MTGLDFRRRSLIGFGAPRTGELRQPDAETAGDDNGGEARDSTEVVVADEDLWPYHHQRDVN